METDRKVITILMAKKLRDMLDKFVADGADAVMAQLEMSTEEFRAYLIDLALDAIALVQAQMKKE